MNDVHSTLLLKILTLHIGEATEPLIFEVFEGWGILSKLRAIKTENGGRLSLMSLEFQFLETEWGLEQLIQEYFMCDA